MARVIAPLGRSAAPATASTVRVDADTDTSTAVAAGAVDAGSGPGIDAEAPTTTPRRRRATSPVVAPAASTALELLGADLRLRKHVGMQAAAARALVDFRSPVFAEVERWQLSVRDQFVAPLRSVFDQTLGVSRVWARQTAMLQSALAGPLRSISQMAWWNDITLWPTDALMTSVLRPLDVVRPQLLDLSRTLDNLLDTARWIGPLHADLWRDLRHVGRRIGYWAVEGASAALQRGDFDELEEFVTTWLEAVPTWYRVEALVEALLEVDLAQYHPDDGSQLLDDLKHRVRELTTERRRDGETVLGLRRGVGTISRIAHPEVTVLHRPSLRSGPSLEDSVLDRLQPDVDPRVVELVNELPAQDRKIAMMKIVSGCAWSAAATHSGAPATRGESVRRRLTRRRDGLPVSNNPWIDVRAKTTAEERDTVGLLRPDVVVVDGVTGIWP